MQIGDEAFTVEARVSRTLPTSVLLGTDVPEMTELLQEIQLKAQVNNTASTCPMDRALAVETRAQARRRERAAVIETLKELASPAHPTSLDESVAEEPLSQTTTGSAESDVPHSETSAQIVEASCQEDMESEPDFPFDDDLFEKHRERQHLSRSQKRQDRYSHYRAAMEKHPLDLTAEELSRLQEEDPTLEGVRGVADGENSTSEGTGFFRRDKLVYRRWIPRDRPSEMIEQLVLPSACHKEVMLLAHKIPLSGHLGKLKTAARLSS